MIYLAVNLTSGYLEQMFANEESAIAWTEMMTAQTGDLYDIEPEEIC